MLHICSFTHALLPLDGPFHAIRRTAEFDLSRYGEWEEANNSKRRTPKKTVPMQFPLPRKCLVTIRSQNEKEEKQNRRILPYASDKLYEYTLWFLHLVLFITNKNTS